MGLLDKALAKAEQAAVKAKEGIDDAQAKRELGQAYTGLGRVTFELVESGELSHPGLEQAVARVRELEERFEEPAPAEPSEEPPAPAA
jgi:hypothetical protein